MVNILYEFYVYFIMYEFADYYSIYEGNQKIFFVLSSFSRIACVDMHSTVPVPFLLPLCFRSCDVSVWNCVTKIVDSNLFGLAVILRPQRYFPLHNVFIYSVMSAWETREL